MKNGDERQALERLQWYQDVFGKDRWYVEFQEHDIPELTQVNKRLFAWAKQYDLPMVVTNDVHYVKEEDANPHDVLLCVQTSSLVSQAERMRMSGATYFLKSAAQMRQTFLPLADLPDSAFTNTLKIAEMCDVDPEEDQYHLPDYPIPEGYDYQTYLRHLTMEGLKRRYNDRADDPEVLARTEHELKIIHEMGFDVYFLIVWDLCMYAKQRGIWWNVRGSGAGSIVAYATGITTLDPLRNKLIFERFLNPGRVTMPDFDLDFPDDQREELIRYTIEKYGQEQVAQVVTFGRMKARAAVRDIGRAMDIPLTDVDRLAKMIPAIPGKPVTIKDVLTDGHEFYSADLRQAYDDQEYVKELLDTASHLEGVARHSSIHAAAVIVADKPLINYTPLMRPPKSAITDTVTQYEFPILESIGLLKIDFLGLATLTLMREATRLIRERHGIEYTLDNIPLDDPKTYELLTSGDVMGVFQVEGAGMRRVLMELRPSEFEHIGATIALYRPGPMEFIPEYISVLHGEKQPQYDHPLLEPILAETMGVCVYQEQVIQILTDIAGYTTGEADLVRRGISKKAKKVLDEHREIFARGRQEKIEPDARGNRQDLGRVDGLRALRLQPRPHRRLRRDRRADRLPQSVLSRRVHGGAVDGRAPRHGKGGPADRRMPAHGDRSVAARRECQRQQFHHRTPAGRAHTRRRSSRRSPSPWKKARPSAWGWTRSRTSAKAPSRRCCAGAATTPSHRWPISRNASTCARSTGAGWNASSRSARSMRLASAASCSRP